MNDNHATRVAPVSTPKSYPAASNTHLALSDNTWIEAATAATTRADLQHIVAWAKTHQLWRDDHRRWFNALWLRLGDVDHAAMQLLAAELGARPLGGAA